ncbi:MAG: glycosyltransferase family 4 protein [Blautia sp.]|jgi:glycosyltransferase involved in cell wall biosynthesis
MSKTYCIFSAQYLPHMGGVERYTNCLAKGLAARGNKVLIVTTNPGDLPDHEQIDGIPVLRLPSVPLIDGRFPVPKPGRHFFRLHRKLKRLSFDVVLVNTRFYFHSLYGILYGRSHRSRTLVLDHGSGHLSVQNGFFDFLGGLFEHGITALEKCFCKEFYGVSAASSQWLTHFHIKARGTLPNAVDLPWIENQLAHPATDFRAKYHIPADAPVFVYTGRLLPEKGLRPLTEAFIQLRQSRPDAYLILAGDGPLEHELAKLSDPHLILTGRLDAAAVTDLLGSSDIFCLPSVSEGFSTSILEAVACHCYVLVTKNACPFELLEDSSFASIIEEAKPDLIEKAMTDALEEEDRRAKACEKAYQRLEAQFTWDRTVEKLITLTKENKTQ